MSNDVIINILKIAWPVIVLQLGLQIYALIDLFRKKKTKNLSTPIWALIIIFGEILGPIFYLMFGRAEE